MTSLAELNDGCRSQLEAEGLDRGLTDGVISLRGPVEGDAAVLIKGRDPAFQRFMGDDDAEPNLKAIVQDGSGQIVGWIDHDLDRGWLASGEVNIGYNIFPEHRGLGLARRSLVLLVSFLAKDANFTAATLLIDPANAPSIAVAEQAGFRWHDDVDGQLLYKSPPQQ